MRSDAPPYSHQQMEKAFGWSDLPPEGDYVLDFSSLLTMSRNTATTTLSLNHAPCSLTRTNYPFSREASNSAAKVVHKPQSKKVAFAKWLKVRAHEIILGSHPTCELFALECGWRHNGSELVDFEAKEQQKTERRNRPSSRFHLPFEARRDRLLEVTRMTEAELLRLDASMRESRQLSHSNTIYSLLSELITSTS